MLSSFVLSLLLGGLLAVVGDRWIEAEPLRVVPRLIGWAGILVAVWSLAGIAAVATVGVTS